MRLFALLCLISALIGCGQKSYLLTVETSPSGIPIELDGKPLGKSPAYTVIFDNTKSFHVIQADPRDQKLFLRSFTYADAMLKPGLIVFDYALMMACSEKE